MRERDPDGIAKWRPFLFYLTQALERLPSVKKKVFRGIAVGFDAGQYAVGCAPHWPGFSSTSAAWRVAHNFASEAGKKGLVFVLRVRRGKAIAAFSRFPKEEEVLLPANSHFRVTNLCMVHPNTLLGLDHDLTWPPHQLSLEKASAADCVIVVMEEV